MLKEQVEALLQENAILKRAVAIQHERQKEFEDRNQEFQQLKQLVSQYQDQLRTLEVWTLETQQHFTNVSLLHDLAYSYVGDIDPKFDLY